MLYIRFTKISTSFTQNKQILVFKFSYLMMQEEWYKVETKQDTADRAMNIFCEVGKTSWRGDKCRSTTTEGSF